MPTAQPPSLSYEEVLKIDSISARCGRVAKVSACSVLFGGSSLCRVNQFSVVHEYGVDA